MDTDPSTISTSLLTRPIPILLGATQNEGLESAARLYLANQAAFTSPESLKTEVLPRLLTSFLGRWRGKQTALLEAVHRQYLTELNTGDVTGMLTAVGEMIGDLSVHSCMRETMVLHREFSSNPLYAFIFSHSGGERQARLSRDIGRVMGLLDTESGTSQYGLGQPPLRQRSGPVWRGDDLLYLFDLEDQARQSASMMRTEDRLISQNLTHIWATFAARGYPVFSEGLLQSQGQQLQLQSGEWPAQEARGALLYYNISVRHSGLFQDFRKPVSHNCPSTGFNWISTVV